MPTVEKIKNSKNTGNLQDGFLSDLSDKKAIVAIYLVNGIKLQGTVESFDQYVLLLSSGGTSQMVYKHAISTIVPAAASTKAPTVSGNRPRHFFNDDNDDA